MAESATQRCAERLAERARRDPFLGQVDEWPQIDEQLSRLNTRIAAHEASTAEHTDGLLRDCRDKLAAVESVVAETRTEVSEVLAALRTAGRDNALKAAQRLTALGARLARNLRPQLVHALDALAPRHQLLPRVLAELDAFKCSAAGELPESAWLLVPRRPGVAPIPGQSLWDAYGVPELDRLCRFPPLARTRLRRLRRQLRRRYRKFEISPREMAIDALCVRSAIDIDKLVDRHQTAHAELEGRLADAWRALRYSVESTTAELDELAGTAPTDVETQLRTRLPEVESLLGGALDQVAAAVHDAEVVYRTIVDGGRRELTQDRDRAFEVMRRGLREIQTLRGRWRWARYTLEKRARRRLRAAGARVEERTALARHGVHALRHRGERLLTRVREALGLAAIPEETAQRIADLPLTIEAAEHFRSLPAIHRRLFSAEPLTNREFLVGRDDELALLAECVERWQQGRAAAVAIVGPEGSGKSSLINCFEAELPAAHGLVRIVLSDRLTTAAELVELLAGQLGVTERPEDPAALAAALLATPRRVVAIERLHNLFLRVPGGQGAALAFLQVLLATRDHFLWVTSCRLYPWKRLDYLFDTARFYTHVVETTLHNQDELRDAVLRRQRASGYELVFSDKSIPARHIRRLRLHHELEAPVVQAAITDYYFDALIRASGGNIESAFYFWMLSLRHEGERRIVALPCMKLDDRVIRQLPRLELFTLAELMGHGALSVDEHTRIFRTDPQQSLLTLERLRHGRLAESYASDDRGTRRYAVSPVFQHITASVLRDLNILY